MGIVKFGQSILNVWCGTIGILLLLWAADGFLFENKVGQDVAEIVTLDVKFTDTYTNGQHLVINSRFTNHGVYEIQEVEYVVDFYDCVGNNCEYLQTRNYSSGIPGVRPRMTAKHHFMEYKFDLPEPNGKIVAKVKTINFVVDRGWF